MKKTTDNDNWDYLDDISPVYNERKTPKSHLNASKARSKLLEYLNIDLNQDTNTIQTDDNLMVWVFDKDLDNWVSLMGQVSYQSPKSIKDSRQEREDFSRSYYTYWDEQRKRVLDRDNHTCQGCNKHLERLEVHHIVPKVMAGTDFIDNLITLCRQCHVTHEHKEYDKEVRKTMVEIVKGLQHEVV